MRNRLLLKVCGLKHKNNLYDVIASGVDFVGMIFYEKSPRYVVDSLHPEDVWFLADEVGKIGVFVNSDLEYIQKYARLYHLDYIQLHGDESPEQCTQLKEKGYQIIKAIGIGEDFDFATLLPYEPYVDFFLFDTKAESYGGTGKSFNWNILQKYQLSTPVFIGGGVGIDNLQQLIENNFSFLYAIDMNSKLEIEPGLKDITLVNEAVKILKA
ncbi:MAG: phosphoribosylanthranilate isomerase [Chitinophagales bacterium]|nr:phosphoribosylanthranilate isomerase [Chitinophagales bacterium]MCZ2393300.1 phosphoribosylanthranilate isomerase [Chitinophagales bacterium]